MSEINFILMHELFVVIILIAAIFGLAPQQVLAIIISGIFIVVLIHSGLRHFLQNNKAHI